jgi:hypothetical protein
MESKESHEILPLGIAAPEQTVSLGPSSAMLFAAKSQKDSTTTVDKEKLVQEQQRLLVSHKLLNSRLSASRADILIVFKPTFISCTLPSLFWLADLVVSRFLCVTLFAPSTWCTFVFID